MTASQGSLMVTVELHDEDQGGDRPGDPQCSTGPADQLYSALLDPLRVQADAALQRVCEKRAELDLSWDQQQVFDCYCQPQLTQVLGTLGNGDLVVGSDPNAVEVYCEDGLPFGTRNSVPNE